MITRENYEEHFLLYVDNELSATARSAVEKFVADNADLKEELETLLQCRVDVDHHEVFGDKEPLLQADLLSYIDGELDQEGRRGVEELVNRYPSKAVELQQLSMTVSHPDLSVIFPDKESLYRSERRRILFMPWMQAGIAAAVLGVAALLLLTGQHPDEGRVAQGSPVKKITPATVTPAKPAPLYSTGTNDQDPVAPKNETTVEGIAKNAQRSQQRKAAVPTPEEKAPEVAIQQQEVAQVTTVPTTTNDLTHSGDPALVAEVKPDVSEKTLIKPAAIAAVNIPKEQSSFATQALLEEAQADETRDMVAAAPAGKSKLRGLLRKVSRTFGKTAERDDDGQKEVLISAFQVAVK